MFQHEWCSPLGDRVQGEENEYFKWKKFMDVGKLLKTDGVEERLSF